MSAVTPRTDVPRVQVPSGAPARPARGPARHRGLRVAFTPGVARWVARRGFSTEFGARDLLRVVRNEIEPRLSALLLDESVRADQIVRAGIRRGELHFGVED